jgi:hypothetical protein
MAQLFEKFEVNKTPWWTNVAHLVGGSCALHLVLVACVLYIPGLRSAFSLVGDFRGAGMVSEDYRLAQVGERAQIIEFPHERFQYPEGYFSNGEQPPQLAQDGGPAPVIVQQYTPPPPVRLPRYRAPRARALPTPEPSPTPQASPSPAVASKDEKPEEKKTAEELEHEKQLEKIASSYGVGRPKTINKKPFTDWLDNANKLKESGQLDLSGTIEMTAEADIQPDGTLDHIEVAQKTGDTKLQELGTQLLQALGASRGLSFLGQDGHIVLTLKMDNTDISAVVTTEVATEDEAAKKAKGYSSLLTASSIFKIGGDEAAEIYKNTKVTSSGKQITLNFSMPRQTAGDMLKKQLVKPPTS